MGDSIQNFRLVSDSLDILIVAIIFFYILKSIEGTRSSQILVGVGAMAILYFVSRKWGLFTLNWLLTHFLGIAILIVVILLQDDIKRGLANIGKKPLLLGFRTHKISDIVVQEVAEACFYLSSQKIGALIAIERLESLKTYAGKPINGTVSSEIIATIFNPASSLHDGGMIIKNDTILSAGVFFPISTDPELKTEFGTRHRAAIKLSSDTDALVIVVSEETGKISLVVSGNLKRVNSEESLKEVLFAELRKEDTSARISQPEKT